MNDRNVNAHEALSALTDGEASAREVAQACAAWRNDPEVQARWHAYQVIGDAMRSPEPMGQGTPTPEFLKHFRHRLAQEPVVLAPAAAVGRSQDAAAQAKVLRPLQKRAWSGPIAVAASFVAVVAALLGNQVGAPAGSGVLLGAATPSDGSLASGLVAPRVLSLADVEPSFSRPAKGAPELVHDPRVEQAMSSAQLVRVPPELSFSNAEALTRPVSYDLR